MRSKTPRDLHYLFAPLKHARLDYMVQKAVEMGASRLQPVLTRHAQVARVNLERMRANAIEAAEQCGILTLPEIRPPLTLQQAIAALEPERVLVFCDEEAPVKDPVAALAQAAKGRPKGSASARRADRSGGRLCGGRARRAAARAERGSAFARAAHPAGRHGGGRRAGAGRGGARRLALSASAAPQAPAATFSVRSSPQFRRSRWARPPPTKPLHLLR